MACSASPVPTSSEFYARMLDTLVFDMGETIFCDDASFGGWADWLGIPRHTFSAVLGGLRTLGRPTSEVFDVFRPGFTYAELVAERGIIQSPQIHDFYPDFVPTAVKLRMAGYRVGIAGNQSDAVTHALENLNLPVDFVESSSTLGAMKPDPDFFFKLVARQGLRPSQTLYVGDNYVNDVTGAVECGLHAALLVRGPWAHLHVHRGLDTSKATIVADSLTHLASVILCDSGADDRPSVV